MTHIIVGTAGHIDHGKSALVQALTGVDPDRLKEEKARGITIDLGFAHLDLGDLTVAFVDVPGHERFVKTMLAGAGGVDCVMLIVAADESVMPQTREHFEICRLLAVPHGLVVLTKTDLVDEETLELVGMEVRELVAGSFLEGAPMVPVSARTGAGLEALVTSLREIAVRVEPRQPEGRARLPIDRAFTLQGFGTVVTGTLVSGRIGVDEELTLVPGGTTVRVRGLHVHGRRRDVAASGQRTAVNLGGIEVDAIARGQSLTAPGAITITRRVDATLSLLPGIRALRHGARVRFHQGTSELLGRVAIAGGESSLAGGESATVRIRLEGEAALTRGDRFIIRAYSPPVTIGGGRVLDPDPPRAGVRTPAGQRRFAALQAEVADAVRQMVRDAGSQGLALAAIVSRAGETPAGAAALAAQLAAGNDIVRVADRLFGADAIHALSERLMSAVRTFHQAQPLADGLPREEAKERVFSRAHPVLFEHVLERLQQAGALVARDRLAVAGHRLGLTDDETRAHDTIERVYRAAGLKPPDQREISAESGIAPATVDRMVSLLLRKKVLARVDTLVFHADTLQALRAEIAALKATAPGGRATVDVAMFKERYGITRKFAIPLLEWLDRERVTRRVGETRVVL